LAKHNSFVNENSNSSFSEKTIDKDPFVQFNKWFSDIIRADIGWPEAMSLATVSSDGKPSIRTVLLKEIDDTGFIFFTNYKSKKANDLKTNPGASLLFYWKELERQVRIEGVIEKVSREKSEEYFHSRPRDSQIGAWISMQSTVIPDRKTLDEKFNEFKQKIGSNEVSLPEFWGGYKLLPDYFEFWQGRENRLHDRICYKLENGEWEIFRLAP